MEDKQNLFNLFMDEFVKLDIDKKNKELIEKQKKLLAFLLKYASDNKIEYNFIKSREVIDIENPTASNEDYLEAMMVYMENTEELIGTILKNINNSNY